MRLYTALVLVTTLGVASPAVAQSPQGSPIGTIPPLHGPLPTGTIPTFTGPPPIALPPVGLPLSQIGLPPPAKLPTAKLPPVRHGNRNSNSRRSVPAWPVVVYLPPQVPVVSPSQDAIVPLPVAPRRSIGTLELDVVPDTVQVFVDGYYAGAPADVRGQFALEPGAHRVDLIDPAYEPVTFDVRIVQNESIAYRRVLQPVSVAAAPAPLAPPAKAKTFYMIPGCYLGDVPPKDAGLPSTCDVKRTVVFER